MNKKRHVITKIGIYWFKNHVCGIRLVDDKGLFLVDSVWYDGMGDWEFKEIPEGTEIIGLKANTTLNFSIPSLSFIIWEPKNTHKLNFNPLAISLGA